MYFTITGLYHYYGDKFLEKGMNVTLEKDVTISTIMKQLPLKLRGWVRSDTLQTATTPCWESV